MTRGQPASSARLLRPAVVAILALYLVLALIYNSATPIFEASDEFRHYLTVRYLVLNHALPLIQSSDDPFAPWQEAGQPPLYYFAGAAISGWVDTSNLPQITDFNPHAQAGVPSTSPDSKNLFVHSAAEDFPYYGVSLAAHLVRLFSIMLGAGTVYLTYRLARTVAPGFPAVALLAMALVAFSPQFLFVSASIDNDNLVTLASTAALLLMAQIGLGALTGRRLWLLSGTIGVAMLSKLSGLGLPPLAAIVVAAQSVKAGGRRKTAERLLVLATMPVALSGWWFVRNWLVYGEPTGLRTWAELVHTRSADALELLSEAPGLFFSYWAVFGAFDIQADGWVYGVYLALSIAGIVGLVTARRRLPARRAVLVLAAWFAIELLALVRWTMSISASTGRLLFPAIAALAVLLALGLLMPLPPRRQPFAAAGVSALLLGLAIYMPLRYIFPAYERPAIASSRAAIGQPSQAGQITYGGKLALLGYDLSPAMAQPGHDVGLRLYWQVLAGMDQNYSVTTQLLTGEGAVGQDDSFPGQGRIATRRLRAGQYFSDTYTIRISATARPPLIAQVKVGLYDDRLAKLPAVDGAGQELAEPIVGELAIQGPAGVAQPGPTPLVSFGDEVGLLAGTADPETVAAGGTVNVKLRWQAQRRMSRPYTVFAHLADDTGRPMAQHDAQPREGAFPTTWWATGEVIDDTLQLAVPAGTPPGRYQLLVGAYEQPSLRRLAASTGGDAFRLASIAVLPAS
ncbi:MAG TPA: phospholipid carrier-dependent glycosyltransferase [Chloroflexota bacterium]